MKLSRRHFLTRAAGISAAALIVTLPVTEEYNASGKGRVHRIPMGDKARAIIHDACRQANAAIHMPCDCRGMVHLCRLVT